MNKTLIIFTMLCTLGTPFKECNAHSSVPNCGDNYVRRSGEQGANKNESTACIGGTKYTLQLDEKHGRIVIMTNNGSPKTLHRFNRGLRPSLVGANGATAFLPIHLQPYIKRGILLYTSAIRSTSGDGGGQCGSGVEQHLHTLDIRQKHVRSVAHFLIVSCNEGIEMDNYDSNSGLGGIEITNNRLQINFLFYRGKSRYPKALVSDDLSKLDFL